MLTKLFSKKVGAN